MGKVHTDKDIEVGPEQIRAVERKLNGHTSMLMKITRMGEDHHHEGRMRETNLTHSGNVSSMYLLVKDHKPVGSYDPEDGPPTRPVHTAYSGMDNPLSNLVSDLIEPVADIRADTNEVISTEDELSRVDEHNQYVDGLHEETDDETPGLELDESRLSNIDATDESKFDSFDTNNCNVHNKDNIIKEPKLRKNRLGQPDIDQNNILSDHIKEPYKKTKNRVGHLDNVHTKNNEQAEAELGKNGRFTNKEKMIVAGFDVKTLYPSLTARHAAKVIKEVILKSKMKWEGINYKEAARYCAMCYDQFEMRANGLDRIAPWRRYRKGCKPGVTGSGPLGMESDDEVIWVFPNREPTELEKKRLLASCFEIAVRVAFTSHMYQFGGKTFLQKDGGPIGVRLAGAAARIVMGEWDARLNSLMEVNSLMVWLRK